MSLTGLGLTFIEASRHMPFEIKRPFDLHDVHGCLGIVRAYVWRVYENTKKRPAGVVLREMEFN